MCMCLCLAESVWVVFSLRSVWVCEFLRAPRCFHVEVPRWKWERLNFTNNNYEVHPGVDNGNQIAVLTRVKYFTRRRMKKNIGIVLR